MDNEQLVLEMIQSANRMRKVTHKYSFGQLSHKEFFMLSKLVKASEKSNVGKGIYVSSIAREMDMAVPAVSRMLKGLEHKGFIERQVDEDNRRNTFVRVTEEGKQERERVHKLMHSHLSQVISRMGEKNTKMMIEFVNNMASIMEEVWLTNKEDGNEVRKEH